jgi:rubrerythrin
MTKRQQGDAQQINELLYQALETELGGELIYKAAISCAVTPDLKEEWEGYLDETKTHQDVLLNVFQQIGLDPAKQTPGRKVLSHIANSLVKAMEMAKKEADPKAAELVAAECVVLAETKDTMNWGLIGVVAEQSSNKQLAQALKEAHAQVAQDLRHHLYHTKRWGRELWIQSLGFPAALPPPEEQKQVETAIGASRAEQQREKML